MSRIKTPPRQESNYRSCFNDDLEDEFMVEGIPLHEVIVYGLIFALNILIVQYIVLRCTGAVKKQNICSFLLKGTLITLFLSIISVGLFHEQYGHLTERDNKIYRNRRFNEL